MYKKMKLPALAIGFALLTSACANQNTVLKQIDLGTEGSGVDASIGLSAQLDLNGFSLGAFELPVFDPRSGQVYGSIETAAMTGGLSQVTLNLAIGQIIANGGHEIQSAVLPNGRSIPIQTGSNNVWMLNAGNSSRIYVAALENETLVGFALVIPQFDSLSSSIPIGLNFFPVIPVRSDLDVAAGIFTGTAPSTSGVGLFADVKQGISIPVSSGKMFKMARSAGLPSGVVGLSAHTPSSKNQQKLGKGLQKLKKRNPVLTIQ